MTKEIVENNAVFNGLTEKEKSSISNRSTKLFTLSAIYNANKALLNKTKRNDFIATADKDQASEFWRHVTKNISEWKDVKTHKIPSAQLRQEYVHGHGVILQALGYVGRDIMKINPNAWQNYLTKLNKINWLRSNTKLWEGNALMNGRISKTADNVKRTGIVIKKQLKVPLSHEDKQYIHKDTL